MTVSLAACGSEPDAEVTIHVRAFGASVPEANVTVVAHRADGHVLDSEVTDSDGRVVLQGEPDGYVTTWFRWTSMLAGVADAAPGPIQATYAVTTVAPPDGRELVVHGPVDPSLAPVGSLVIDGPAMPGASLYNVFVGCQGASVPQLPATFAITPACLGTDNAIDVAVAAVGVTSTGYVVLGHAAAHVPVVGELARVDVASWDTTAPVLPVQLEGVDAIVRVALRSDHQEVLDELANAVGGATAVELWPGLAVDGITVRGWAPSQGMFTGAFVRDMPGVPAVVEVSAADFPPRMDPVADTVPGPLPTLTWQSDPSADLLSMLLAFDYYSWKLVVPPSAGQVSLPGADGTLVRGGPQTTVIQLVGATDDDRLGLDLHCESQYTSRVVIPSSGEVLFSGWP